MKKYSFIIFILLIFNLKILVAQGTSIMNTKLSSFDKQILFSPEKDWKFSKIPVLINFSWRYFKNAIFYKLIIEKNDNEWGIILSKKLSNTNFYKFKYIYRKNFRWKIVVFFKGGYIKSTSWRYCYYINKKLLRSFPVPIKPENNKIMKNYPRIVVFKWLKSNNRNVTKYQIQIDIFHPNINKWHSELKNHSFLVNKYITKTIYKYNFPADRKSRWRVRGIINSKKSTKWSKWHFFEFKALH